MSIRLCFYFPQSRAIIKHLCTGVEHINMDAFLLTIISHNSNLQTSASTQNRHLHLCCRASFIGEFDENLLNLILALKLLPLLFYRQTRAHLPQFSADVTVTLPASFLSNLGSN